MISKEEKERYDVKKLCRGMAVVMFALTGTITLGLLSEILQVEWLNNVMVGGILVIVVGAVIIGNVSSWFKK